MTIQTGTIETRVPSRMDRLPWARFHWRIVVGLGTVWILDGLEVTMVGSVAARLVEPGSGINLSSGQIGTAAAIYVLGACLGALFFGQLTDMLGRKKLFMLTLLVYLVATVATAFAFSPWYFYLARFFTGAGIGGEYAAINSAIDELIPARVRGRVDLIINGSYWLGAAGGAAAAVFFLNEAIFATWLGWRVAFAVGAVLGVGIILVRRHVPESPRWLFIHGRQDEAERIVDRIEREVAGETGEELAEPGDSITVRQRRRIPFRMIAETAFKLYPRRSVLGIALFTGQAFLYNGLTFNLGTLLSTFYGVASAVVPVFIVLYALSNFAGPVLLGRLFDTIGRIPMIAGTYLGSAALTIPLVVLFLNGALSSWTFLAMVMAIFFLASAGASSAYLTVSEIFPMETRALAIAFFYAVGTAVGGITGPLLFGQLIDTEQRGYVIIAFLIGAGVMALGGVAELFLGVRAEQTSLENLAKPLTAQEAEEGTEDQEGTQQEVETPQQQSQQRQEAIRCRVEAEHARSQAAERRARIHELRSEGTSEQVQAEQTMAEVADLHAQELEERANAHDEFAVAEESRDEHAAAVATCRARAAEERAAALVEQATALTAESDTESRRDQERSEAATERARAQEQRALAEQSRSEAGEAEGADATVSQARADMHLAWAHRHEKLAELHSARAEQDDDTAERYEREAAELQTAAMAADERVRSSEHRAVADGLYSEVHTAEQAEAQRAEIAERERQARETEQHIRERVARRQARERQGLRRFIPGPGSVLGSARMGGLDVSPARTGIESEPDREINMLVRALNEHGPTDRQQLARLVGARYWGPGRFGQALTVAVDEGNIRRLSRRMYGPADSADESAGDPTQD
ncbi:putative MFS family arabinose efflux permease [Halopolyspora algeriensis]|uniref:Putative MFS family arabinose efflux permease n=1 Tax=Halopolyspora algeriensis TaxID=1500506 RepID=A0A368VN09_9ACTN|nr:putative MFS family arabinose efflux permease [Halopolyspora algeriensis]TQM53705.1 putative MFS family arabinose efflux permease [Halopolyspora algeriensis]